MSGVRRVDVDKYRGEWLAWIGNKIVAHNKILKKLQKKLGVLVNIPSLIKFLRETY